MNFKAFSAAMTLALWCGTGHLAQGAHTAFTYQGRLADGGNPATGLYDLKFVLVASESGGPPVGLPETNRLAAVPVTNGLFTVALDFGSAAFDGSARWLEIGVRTNGSSGGFTTLTPRQLVTPTPYAIYASTFAGPVADAQLSPNIARLNADQVFTGPVAFNPLSGPPFTVGSSVVVPNLNAHLLDGLELSGFLLKTQQCVRTMAVLRRLAPGTVPCVLLLGYYAPGDGGGGNFYWDAPATETDNGGTIITPDSIPSTGRWKRLVKDPLSVKWFGAKGDGAANDAPAIQATITACANSGGGTVFVPQGTYMLNSALNFAELGEIPIVFSGAGHTQVPQTGGAGTVLLGNTGGCVIDTHGSSYLTFLRFRIECQDLTNPSIIGFIQGRSDLNATTRFSQFNRYQDLVVFLPSRPGSNGARGSIGFYNIAAEHTIYDQLRVIADSPFFLDSANSLNVIPPYGGSLSGPASMTLVDFRQTTATAWTKFGYELRNCANIHLMNSYASAVAGNTTTGAIALIGDTQAWQHIHISGQFEEWPRLLEIQNSGQDLHVSAMIVNPTVALISLGAGVVVEGGSLDVHQVHGSIQGLTSSGPGAVLRAVTIQLRNTASIVDPALLLDGALIVANTLGAPFTRLAGSRYLVVGSNLNTDAITIAGDFNAAGGHRQTHDGWSQANVVASQTNLELTRAVGRLRMARAGSVTGIQVNTTLARTAGTLTVKVFKNTGLSGVAGAQLGTLMAVIDGTSISRKATTQAKDTDAYAAGDELYLTVTTDGAWLPTTAAVWASLEVED